MSIKLNTDMKKIIRELKEKSHVHQTDALDSNMKILILEKGKIVQR